MANFVPDTDTQALLDAKSNNIDRFAHLKDYGVGPELREQLGQTGLTVLNMLVGIATMPKGKIQTELLPKLIQQAPLIASSAPFRNFPAMDNASELGHMLWLSENLGSISSVELPLKLTWVKNMGLWNFDCIWQIISEEIAKAFAERKKAITAAITLPEA